MLRFREWVKHATAMDSTDPNKVAETILVSLLAEVYGYRELKNLNSEKNNCPGIDLGDEKAKVAFQITSTTNAKKIKETLEKFRDYNWYEKYDRLIIYILTEKQKFKGKGYEEIIDGKFAFDKDKDIWDYRDLLSAVKHLPFERACRVESILEANFGEGRTLTEWEVVDNVERVVSEYSQLFVGREEESQKLNKFLSENSSGVMLVTAGAGFGKTALLANWVNAWRNKDCFIAYHFFTQRYGSVKSAYRNLLRQLYIYYKPTYEQIPHDEEELKVRLYNLLREYAAREDEPLIIVIDGLDEAENTFSPPFPNPLPENVYVIASARAEEGDEHKYLEYWIDNSQPLNLKPLSSEAIAQWLRNTDKLAAFAEDTHFVAQLDEITQGFPLYLSYLTDELSRAAKREEDVREVLEQTPKGFERYVEQQLRRLDELDLPDERWQFFALLAVAKGVLEKEDIKALTGMRDRNLRQLHQSWQVTRWMRISEGKLYAFAHPLLATTFAAQLGDDAEDALQDLIDYCAREKYQSRYALRHYAEHLRDVKRWEDLYKLAHDKDKDFASAQQQQLPDEPDLPLKTVQTALLGAAEEDKAERMAEFLLVHAHRLGQTNAQESPLEALRSGSLEQALALADLNEPERRVLWYLLLVWELKDIGKLKEAQATLERLQNKKLPRLSLWWEGDYGAYLLAQLFDINAEAFTNLHNLLLEDSKLHYLCRHLVASTHFSHALNVMQGMSSNMDKASVLEKVAVAQAQAGKLPEAYQTAQKIGKLMRGKYYWDRAIKAVAIAYAQAGELATALEKAQEIHGNREQAETLVEIAKARDGHQEEVLATFELAEEAEPPIESDAIEVALEMDDSDDSLKKDEALRTRAVALAKVDKLQQALELAQKIGCELLRAWALLEIAIEPVNVGKPETARTALAITLGMKDRIDEENQKVLKQEIIAVMLAEAEKFEAALEQTRAIKNKARKICAMKSIAHLQMQSGQRDARDAALATLTDALEIARAMKDKEPIVLALKVVAVAFAKAGKITAAIEITREIFDEVTQAEALKSIAIIQVQAGDFDKALETVDKIDRERTPGEAFLLAKTTVLARMKKFEAALDTAKEMTSKYTWSDAMCQVAVSRAQAREFDAALDTVQKIYRENQQAAVLGYIAAEQAKAGDLKAAQSTFNDAFGKARQVGQELERATALEAIAEAQVAAGFGFQAMKTAETILINRSEHVPAIAHAFVETGEQENFKKLLIPCAYYLNAAYQMCRYLARLYPEKAEEIAKVMSELN